ncbi:MAG: protein-glutamate O-methyltransferase CheR [Parasphingopyxis sp.]|nr:protein-glutamate O-methyltransferase CheR [Sphingomonadales bacterium]
MGLSEPSARLLTALVEARTGQRCDTAGNWRVESRLGGVMASRGLTDMDELVGRIVAPGGAGLARDVVDAVLNNETYFFRDSETFNHIGRFIRHMHDRIEPGRTLRIWSAGCSTGQEIYSLALLIAEELDGLEGRPVELLGTDVSTSAIRRAERGEYNQFEIQRGLPVRRMLRWFEQQGESWRVQPALRAMVRFRSHNILEAAPAGFFHLILCRNVLMYFPGPAREAALARFSDALVPEGGLVLGAGETVLGRSDRFRIAEDFRGIYEHLTDFPPRAARLG